MKSQRQNTRRSQSSEEILEVEHEDQLPWLELPYDEEVEFTVIGQPIYAAVHTHFAATPNDPPRDFGCRRSQNLPCFMCEGVRKPRKPSTQAYCVVEHEGTICLFRAQASLLNKVEPVAGLRIRVVKRRVRPFFDVLDTETDLSAINHEFDEIPNTVRRKLLSLKYHLDHGNGNERLFQFTNRPPERRSWELED